MKQLVLAVFVGLMLLLAHSVPTTAQRQAVPAEAAALPHAEWSNRLDNVASQLEQPDLSDEALSNIRDDLDAVRAEARQWIAEAAPDLTAVEEEIEALGPAPAEGEEPEPETIAARRQELRDRLAEVAGPLKEADLIIARVGLINSDLVQLRRTRFAERLLARGPSPLSPGVWSRAMPEIDAIATSISRSAKRYLGSPEFGARLRDSLGVILGARCWRWFSSGRSIAGWSGVTAATPRCRSRISCVRSARRW